MIRLPIGPFEGLTIGSLEGLPIAWWFQEESDTISHLRIAVQSTSEHRITVQIAGEHQVFSTSKKSKP